MCGTPASVIRDLARRFAKAKAASMVSTSNFGKYYHGNLIERAQALVFALSGQFGKKGSGFVGFPFLSIDGLETHIRNMFSLKDMMNPVALKMIGKMISDTARMKLAGYTDEMIANERIRDILASGAMTSGALFWYLHGGLFEYGQQTHKWDPYLKRPVAEVLDEALEKGWQSVWPRRGNPPRFLFVYAGNPLRRVRAYPLLLKHMWPKLRMVVTLETRMTTTALHSDYVLPSAGWYERSEHKWATTLMPYIHSGEKATTYYEARSDWEILSRLAQTVEERAKERGMTSFVDRQGNERPLHNVYEKFSQGGEYGPTDDEKICAALLDASSNVGGLKWEQLKKKGFSRFTDLGGNVELGNATEVPADDTITPLTQHVFEKKPYPTLSRRMQFFQDHELYLEMGEELPTHKEPLMSGGDYPLMLTGGHTRWSIHGNWRDNALMLQQGRGEPWMLMNPLDAATRGVAEGAQVRVFNDIDEFQVMVKLSPAMRRGQLMLYHAWENYQFKHGKGFQNMMPVPMNPVELAGEQFHLRPMILSRQPSMTDRETRVEVELA
jgi:anaerobic selenocysteine-containing dehydrogenase